MYTYATLTAALQNWLEDDDAEFVGTIPEIIELGETRLMRDLDLAMFTGEGNVTVSAGTELVTKPGVAPLTQLNYQSLSCYPTGGAAPADHATLPWMVPRSDEFVRDYNGQYFDPLGHGIPRYYSESSESQWRLAPVPNVEVELTYRYTARPDGLSDVVTETWFSVHAPDLLLRACLAESERFLKSDDRITIWEQDYVSLLQSAREESYSLLRAQYPRLNIVPMPTQQR